jgi:hypothetical protein
VDESAEAFAAPDLAGLIRADEVWAMPGCGWSQAERAMRPVGVVVLDVDTQDTLEVSAVCDQEPVEAVATNRADPALGVRVRVRRAKRCADDLDALALEDLVEGAAEPRSWIRNRIGLGRSASDQASWRACRVVQRPSGLALQPARCTRRVLSSMKKSTYSRPSQSVSTVKKSHAMIDPAWARRNSRQLNWARMPAGETPPCLRILATGSDAPARASDGITYPTRVPGLKREAATRRVAGRLALAAAVEGDDPDSSGREQRVEVVVERALARPFARPVECDDRGLTSRRITRGQRDPV